MEARTTRAIVEDLLPLYQEGLLSEESARWVEEQLEHDPSCKELLELSRQSLPEPPTHTQADTPDYAHMMKKINRKLSVYQLIFVAISFFMAIRSSPLGNSFEFALWYPVLGAVTYLFYRDIRMVLFIAFVPVFLWSLGDLVWDWMHREVKPEGALRHAVAGLFGSALIGVLHTVFALAGSLLGWLGLRKKPLATALLVVLVLLIGVLVLLIGGIYNAFNGNPVSKALAKHELQTYLAETYPEFEWAVRAGSFNFKFAQYEFDAAAIGQVGEDGRVVTYHFAVRGWLLPRVVSDELRIQRFDESVMERLSGQAEGELRDVLSAEVDSFVDVSAYVEVLEGELPDEIMWQKDMAINDKLDLYIVLDATGADKEQVLQEARRIQAVLRDGGYVYDKININVKTADSGGMKGEGAVRFSVAFNEEDELRLKDIKAYEP